MAYTGSSAGRTAAILTNGEVYGTVVDLRNAIDGKLAIAFDLTIGNLTSVTWRLAVGPAATPTATLWIDGIAMTGSITGSTSVNMVFNCAGFRYARLALTGVGDVTNSECAFTYGYQDYVLAPTVDGVIREDG